MELHTNSENFLRIARRIRSPQFRKIYSCGVPHPSTDGVKLAWNFTLASNFTIADAMKIRPLHKNTSGNKPLLFAGRVFPPSRISLLLDDIRHYTVHALSSPGQLHKYNLYQLD